MSTSHSQHNPIYTHLWISENVSKIMEILFRNLIILARGLSADLVFPY